MAGFSVTIFEVRTGRIVQRDLPVIGIPQFNRQINQEGSWGAQLLVGDVSVPPAMSLRQIFAPWRFGAAVVWDDSFIVQFGPISSYQFDDTSNVVQISGGGIWTLLNRRTLINPAYALNPTTSTSLLSMDASGDLNYGPLSLHTIAKRLVQDMASRGAAYSLPMDFPADIAGSAVRSYPIYDLVSVGQRLKELTQVENGPDVDFQAYFDPAQDGYIRYQMLIGNPILDPADNELFWDYGSGLRSVSIDGDGSAMVSGDFVRGNGTERASLVAYNRRTTLTDAGWPATELVDNRSSVIDGATLQGYANGNLDLFDTPVELWAAVVRADVLPVLGSYQPGTFAFFNMIDHAWIPDGAYHQRILGFQNGAQVNEVRLILQAIEGAV